MIQTVSEAGPTSTWAAMTNTIRDDAARQRYELEMGGVLAFIEYRREVHALLARREGERPPGSS